MDRRRIMGTTVKQWAFTEKEHQTFKNKLYEQLDSLQGVLATPSFGNEPLQIGAELEMYLTDEKGNVSFCNQLLIDKLNDSQFQPELNQYNVELNLSPVKQVGKPFTALREEILKKTKHLETIAKQENVNVIPIGILPTLTKNHLNISNMTNIPRYHNLANHLYERRGEAFEININGKQPLSISFDDICAEGANTSFQVHLMTPYNDFCDVFNAAQLSASMVAAISANSPIFLGSELWDETRIALFKQSLDIRQKEQTQWQQPTRVNFGFGWVRKSPWELFAEAVALYPTILPVIDNEENKAGLPRLSELSTHMGTLWPWHRPVYCHHGNGHVRIEFRAIPAGPTSIDMVANAAFAIGLAMGLAKQIDHYVSIVPFRFAEYNFYRAAQHGLDAKVLWPLASEHHPEEVDIKKVIQKMIPIAHDGLISMGVDNDEATSYINVIQDRLNKQITGAIWLKKTLSALEKTQTKKQACQTLVMNYLTNCRTCMPVSQWEQPWL